MSVAIYQAGAVAAEQIAAGMLRVDITKALDPLKATDFVLITERLSRRINAAVAGDEARAVKAALDTLDVNWDRMSDGQVDKVLKAANQILKAKIATVPPKFAAILETEGPKLAKATRASTKRTFKMNIGADLSSRDRKVEKLVRQITTNYVRDELGNRADWHSARARGIVERGLQAGRGPIEIGKSLQTSLGNSVSRGPGYWRVVANSFSTHARTFSQFGAFDDAGITEWEFHSVLDEVTSNVCRFYHGTVFTTEVAMNHINKITSLKDPEEITQASPWVNEGTDQNGSRILYVKQGDKNVRIATVARSGYGKADDVGEFSKGKSPKQLAGIGAIFPPLHGHCRSTVLPV